MKPPRVPGRLLAWTALLVALGASVGANVAFARPELGPRLSAAVAPVLVVLGAGLLERVPLASARRWQRWLAGGGLVFVVGSAFVTSYEHQHALLLAYGNPDLSATLLPLAVDALILMASVSLAVIAERRRQLAADTAIQEPGRAPVALSDSVSDTAVPVEQPKPRVRAPRKMTTAERVAAAKRRAPAASTAEIARRVGVTERTVARHLAAMTVADVIDAGDGYTPGLDSPPVNTATRTASGGSATSPRTRRSTPAAERVPPGWYARPARRNLPTYAPPRWGARTAGRCPRPRRSRYRKEREQ